MHNMSEEVQGQVLDDVKFINECYRLRSLGAAIPWSSVDRLVEMLAGKELPRKKRCEACNGDGQRVWTKVSEGQIEMVSRLCTKCNGKGYQEG